MIEGKMEEGKMNPLSKRKERRNEGAEYQEGDEE